MYLFTDSSVPYELIFTKSLCLDLYNSYHNSSANFTFLLSMNEIDCIQLQKETQYSAVYHMHACNHGQVWLSLSSHIMQSLFLEILSSHLKNYFPKIKYITMNTYLLILQKSILLKLNAFGTLNLSWVVLTLINSICIYLHVYNAGWDRCYLLNIKWFP